MKNWWEKSMSNCRVIDYVRAVTSTWANCATAEEDF